MLTALMLLTVTAAPDGGMKPPSKGLKKVLSAQSNGMSEAEMKELKEAMGESWRGSNTAAAFPTSIPPGVTVGAPQIQGAGVPTPLLSRYVQTHKASIQGCYERLLRVHPELTGELMLKFEITSLGRTRNAVVASDTTGVEALGTCVRAVARAWEFPFTPDAAATVQLKFQFAPPD